MQCFANTHSIARSRSARSCGASGPLGNTLFSACSLGWCALALCRLCRFWPFFKEVPPIRERES
ncbi:hypothetical protein, partial [Haematospirillum jordaniae]|uniref:hypothetical protein n=1 Tax=Haematospirillum jordaniae TaxID=1549855 RepID=UPI001ADE863F